MIAFKKKPGFAYLPLLFVFLFVSSSSVVFGKELTKYHIDLNMVIIGNIILFSVTLLSFLLYQKALLADNTQAFLRNVYSGMMIKFFVCISATFIYVLTTGNAVNRPALFILMFLYLLYTFMETALLLKRSRQIKETRNA